MSHVVDYLALILKKQTLKQAKAAAEEFFEKRHGPQGEIHADESKWFVTTEVDQLLGSTISQLLAYIAR